MAKEKRIYAPIKEFPQSDNRLMVIDFGSLSFHQIFALQTKKKAQLHEIETSGYTRSEELVLDTVEAEIKAWKAGMVTQILDSIRLFNPIDVVIALEGSKTWRHDLFKQYYRENHKIKDVISFIIIMMFLISLKKTTL